jgi:hypothetical protein
LLRNLEFQSLSVAPEPASGPLPPSAGKLWGEFRGGPRTGGGLPGGCPGNVGRPEPSSGTQLQFLDPERRGLIRMRASTSCVNRKAAAALDLMPPPYILECTALLIHHAFLFPVSPPPEAAFGRNPSRRVRHFQPLLVTATCAMSLAGPLQRPAETSDRLPNPLSLTLSSP